MIHVVTGDPRPIFRQIVDGIRMKIATGELAVGAKLPSVRGLAMQLMINSNTVARAYTELIALGQVESQQGRGYFVCKPRQVLSDQERRRRLDEAIQTFVVQVTGLEYLTDEVMAGLREKLQALEEKKCVTEDSGI